jgi:hypothetical protein
MSQVDQARTKEIILTTDQMSFFVYNLFAHDISHDGHPSGLGGDRFPSAISRSSGIAQGLMNSGGGKQQGGIITRSQQLRQQQQQQQYQEQQYQQQLLEQQLSKNNETFILSVYEDLFNKKKIFYSSEIPRNNPTYEDYAYIVVNTRLVIHEFQHGMIYTENFIIDNEIINPYDCVISSEKISGIGNAIYIDIPKKSLRIIFYVENPYVIIIKGLNKKDTSYILPNKSNFITSVQKSINYPGGFDFETIIKYSKLETYNKLYDGYIDLFPSFVSNRIGPIETGNLMITILLLFSLIFKKYNDNIINQSQVMQLIQPLVPHFEYAFQGFKQ